MPPTRSWRASTRAGWTASAPGAPARSPASSCSASALPGASPGSAEDAVRILLISANQERSPDPVAPLGVCYVATATAEAGHDVSVLDLCFAVDPERAVQEAVRDVRPQMIGISLRNVDNCAYPDTVSYLAHYRGVVEACRRASAAPVILGGSAFTTMPAYYLRQLGAPYGVVGEGEVAFVRLLDRLAAGGGAADVCGIAIW